MRLKLLKNWPKDNDGAHKGVCLMCRNTGITHFLYGFPAGYCGPCHRSGHYELVEVEE
jgi:hypothetical protein